MPAVVTPGEQGTVITINTITQNWPESYSFSQDTGLGSSGVIKNGVNHILSTPTAPTMYHHGGRPQQLWIQDRLDIVKSALK